MSQAPPTRRRWFQFGLRELFWLMIVVALVLFAANERRERIRERAAYESELEAKLHDARIERKSKCWRSTRRDWKQSEVSPQKPLLTKSR